MGRRGYDGVGLPPTPGFMDCKLRRGSVELRFAPANREHERAGAVAGRRRGVRESPRHCVTAATRDRGSRSSASAGPSHTHGPRCPSRPRLLLAGASPRGYHFGGVLGGSSVGQQQITDSDQLC